MSSVQDNQFTKCGLYGTMEEQKVDKPKGILSNCIPITISITLKIKFSFNAVKIIKK